MKKYLPILLLAVSITAFADGVPLLLQRVKPSKQETADIEKINANPRTKEVASVVQLNRYALDANLIEIELAGKVHRFSGAKHRASETDVWNGKAGEGESMSLYRSDEGILSGSIDVRGASYRVQPINPKTSKHYVIVREQPIETADDTRGKK